MHAIYAFLGEPMFEHDFGHVDYDVTGFDERAVLRGCTPCAAGQGRASRDVAAAGSVQAILNDAFWRDPQRIPAGLQVV